MGKSVSELTNLISHLSTGGRAGGAIGMPSEVQRFIEELTFADPEDIQEALQHVLAENWMGLPAWARNLAFRLLCLQQPDDPEVLGQAGADLLSFGPDWDEIAEALLARSEALRARQNSAYAMRGDFPNSC